MGLYGEALSLGNNAGLCSVLCSVQQSHIKVVTERCPEAHHKRDKSLGKR